MGREICNRESPTEVKGKAGSITKDITPQLLADLMEHLKTTGRQIDGALIGEGRSLDPLEQSDTNDEPVFLKDAIRLAENDINIALIGNGRSLYPLKSRDTNNEPVFLDDAIRLAENDKVGLLSMAELLDLYCRMLEYPAQREELLSKYFNSADEDR